MSKELSNHRLEQAKEDLDASKFLYDGKFYKSANICSKSRRNTKTNTNS